MHPPRRRRHGHRSDRAPGHLRRQRRLGNATTEALVIGLGGVPTATDDEIPFSSARKWSAASFGGSTYVLGASEMVEPMLGRELAAGQVLANWTEQGRRVLLFAANHDIGRLHDSGGEEAVPELTPLALVALTDELRPAATTTIQGLVEDGIRLKVISGDAPETVAALARQVGLVGDLELISGPQLAEMSPSEFDRVAIEADIFGRVDPEQKERLVASLQRQGEYVAMIGDGVNDTLALRTA